jgi:hypothetical protein
MTTLVHDTVPTVTSRIEWGPVIAGALVAAALGTIAIAFGGAVGLSLTSPWPGSGISLWATGVFIVYWSVLVQVLSFAAGGFLAARLRSRITPAGHEGRFDDGVHGLLMWAVGVLMMAALAAFGGALAAGSASRMAAGAAAGTGAALSGQSSAATPAAINPAEFAVATLLRPVAGATPPASPSNEGNEALTRADLGRVFSSVLRNRELTLRDRDYLAQVVVGRTGASEDEARRRVTEAVNEARDLEIRARQAADQARKSAVLAGFAAAAALLIGLAAACAAAVFGGRQRDENLPVQLWGRPIW